MPIDSSSAYLLIYHGSRDTRSQVSAHQLARLVAGQLQLCQSAEQPVAPVDRDMPLMEFQDMLPQRHHPGHGQRNGQTRKGAPPPKVPVLRRQPAPIVGTAALELAPLPLHQQIRQFGDRTRSLGCKTLRILPLFLLPGVHVTEDIPDEIDQAQHNLAPELDVHLHPFLGSHTQLSHYLDQRRGQEISNVAATAAVIVAHGSRRPGGNEPIEAIASSLGALAAYWSVPPSLSSQVKTLVEAGHQQIAVIPYFLFAGGITDAIAQQVEQLRQQFPGIALHLSKPLGATPDMADLVIELLATPATKTRFGH